MTTMITEVYEALKEANVSDAKAIAAATAIPNKEGLATKEDLLMVRTELKDEINNVRIEFKDELNNVRSDLKEDINNVRIEFKDELNNVRSDLKEDINNVRAELKQGLLKLENKIIVWMGSMFVVAVSILATLMKVL